MKKIFVCVLLSLIAHASDDFDKKLLAGRLDSSDNPYSIISLNLNGKKLTDDEFALIFKRSPNLCNLWAKHHAFANPAPSFAVALQILDLSHGNLQQFPLLSHLQQMRNLTTLDLSHNQIASLGDIVYGDDDTKYVLKNLDVSHNQLPTLDMHLMNELTNLRTADFAHNPIAAVHDLDGIPCCGSPFKTRIKTSICLKKSNFTAEQQAELIARYSIQEAKDYSVKKLLVGGLSAVGLAISGVSTTVAGLAYAVAPHVGAGNGALIVIGSGFGAGAIGFLTGWFVGSKCVTCCTPEENRHQTYFIFKFDDVQENSDTVISLET